MQLHFVWQTVWQPQSVSSPACCLRAFALLALLDTIMHDCTTPHMNFGCSRAQFGTMLASCVASLAMTAAYY